MRSLRLLSRLLSGLFSGLLFAFALMIFGSVEALPQQPYPLWAKANSSTCPSDILTATAFSSKSAGVVTTTGPNGGPNTAMGGFNNGNWIAFSGITFNACWNQVTIDVAAPVLNGGFQLRLDSNTGTLIGTLTLTATGSYTSYQNELTTLTPTTGVHTLYVVAATGGGGGIGNIFSVTLSSNGAQPPPPSLTGPITYWTSKQRRGDNLGDFSFTDRVNDVNAMATGAGINFIRFIMTSGAGGDCGSFDSGDNLDNYTSLNATTMAGIESVLNAIRANNQKVYLEPYALPGMHSPICSGGATTLLFSSGTNATYQPRALQFLHDLYTALLPWNDVIVGYGIVNEPQTPNENSTILNAFYTQAIATIRAVNATMPIVLEANDFAFPNQGTPGSGPGGLYDLAVQSDPYIIYSSHSYCDQFTASQLQAGIQAFLTRTGISPSYFLHGEFNASFKGSAGNAADIAAVKAYISALNTLGVHWASYAFGVEDPTGPLGPGGGYNWYSSNNSAWNQAYPPGTFTPSDTPPASPGFYLSPTGSDAVANTCQAPTSPCLTPERVRTLIEAQPANGIKTAYFRAGTYPRSNTFLLTAADNGTTWQYYPPDGYDSAVLDCGSHAANQGCNPITIDGGSNITINGLKVQNFRSWGVGLHGGVWDSAAGYAKTGGFLGTQTAAADSDVIENMIVDGGWTTDNSGWGGAGIWGFINVTNVKVLHNVVTNQYGNGIDFWSDGDGNTPTGQVNGVIDSNYVANTGIYTSDGGSIYTQQKPPTDGGNSGGTSAPGTGFTITNNYVIDYQGTNMSGTATARNCGVYLDQGSSNHVIKGNIFGPTHNATSAFNPQIYFNGSGHFNVFSGNIVDLGNSGLVIDMVYEYYPIFSGFPQDPPMNGNTYTGNIILGTFTGAQHSTALGVTGAYPFGEGGGESAVLPTVAHNDYWNYAGGTMSTSGSNGINDSSPLSVDPQISGWNYTIAPGSPVFTNAVAFPPIVGGWGPPGFVIPQTGTTPSPVLR